MSNGSLSDLSERLGAALDAIDRSFKLWAKICIMIVDGKRNAFTVSRVLDERGLAPGKDRVEIFAQDTYMKKLTVQWHDISARLGCRVEKDGEFQGWWDYEFDAQVCETLQDLLEMRLGKIESCMVTCRNVVSGLQDLVEDRIGHRDFEIVDYDEGDRHHGEGPVPCMGSLVMMPQTAISVLVRYREIKWPKRKA